MAFGIGALIGISALTSIFGASSAAKSQSRAAQSAAATSLAVARQQAATQMTMFNKAMQSGEAQRDIERRLGGIAIFSAQESLERQAFLNVTSKKAIGELQQYAKTGFGQERARAMSALKDIGEDIEDVRGERLAVAEEARGLGQEGDPIYDLQMRRLNRSLAARGIRQSGEAVFKESGLAASEALRIQDQGRFLTGQQNVLRGQENILAERGERYGQSLERSGMRETNIQSQLAGFGGTQQQAPPATMTQQAGNLAVQTGAGISQAQGTAGAGVMQSQYAQGQSQALYAQGISRLPWQMASMYETLQ